MKCPPRPGLGPRTVVRLPEVVEGLQSIRGLKRVRKRSEKGKVLEWFRGRFGKLCWCVSEWTDDDGG